MNLSGTSHADTHLRRDMVTLAETVPMFDVTPDLVARIHGGDDAALEFVLHRYLPLLRRICANRLRRYPGLLLDTDDVLQDALIRTLRHIPHFVWRNPGSLLAYLRRAICNRIIDAKRKAVRQGECVPLSDDCVAQTTSPLQRVVDKEAIVRYRAGLLRLKRRDHLLIVMRVEQQLTYEEIGRRLQMPSANAARVAVVRAIARLVSALGRV